MTDSLFEIDEPAMPTSSPGMPIRPEQIQQIRDAFDEAGIVAQDDRKTLIESVTVRPVSKLRDLYAVEARRVLQRINERTARNPQVTGSAWDNREEDTWIDKL